MAPVQAVIFDWGDTLMRVLPGFEGPMSDWPRLELVPGVRRALAGLAGRYRLAVGSNAGPSDARLMRLAFDRVGITGYFDQLFTHVELAALKPDRLFFEHLTAGLELEPERCVMIGDDYLADITGARQAGLKTIYYAPAAGPDEAGTTPPDIRPPEMADALITHLAQAPEAVDALARD